MFGANKPFAVGAESRSPVNRELSLIQAFRLLTRLVDYGLAVDVFDLALVVGT